MYAAYGRLIHDVLEATEREAVASQSTHGSIDDALAVLKDHILSTEFGPLTRRTAWQRKAERLLRSMYESWIRPAAVPVLLEHELTAEIDNIPWRGRADRIELIDEALLRIVDYKSSSNARTADQAASSIQLAFYLLAAQSDATVRKHGEAVEAEFWFPAAKRATKWVAFDPARLEETTEIMADIGRRITDEDWTPVVGAGCSRCSVRTTCPEWPEGRESFTR
jgi:RecB family exonuclease